MFKENVIDGAIKEFDGFNISDIVKSIKSKPERTVDYWKNAMDSKKVLSLEFPMVSKEGNLFLYDKDIKVQLDNKETDGFGFNPRRRGDKIGSPYNVIVTSVNEKKNLVKVSSVKASEEARDVLEKALIEGIEKKEYIRVPAIVVNTGKAPNYSSLLVNIAGLGIPGAVRLAEWSPAFTKSFFNVVRAGDQFDVVVTGINDWKSGKPFDCSRRLTIDFDPWKDIEKKLSVRTVVQLRCTAKEQNNFFGTISGLPEINALCEYPEAEMGIEIAVGIDYICRVYAVNEERKLLKLRVVKQLENFDDEMN